jgi:hypothetical protein
VEAKLIVLVKESEGIKIEEQRKRKKKKKLPSWGLFDCTTPTVIFLHLPFTFIILMADSSGLNRPHTLPAPSTSLPLSTAV